MNLEQFYPGTTIYSVEYLDNAIIIHTEPDLKKEVRVIHDLPMLGKCVVVKVSKDASYEWIDVEDNTKRLNLLITSCCKYAPDEHSMEDLLELSYNRCSPDSICEIVRSNSNFQPKTSFTTSESGHDTCSSNSKTQRLKNILQDILENGIPCPADTSTHPVSNDGDSELRMTDFTYRDLKEYLMKQLDLESLSLQTLHQAIHTYFPDYMPASKPDNLYLYLQNTDDSNLLRNDIDYASQYYSTDYRYYKMEQAPMPKYDFVGQILSEITPKEYLSFSVSAWIFEGNYIQWMNWFESSVRTFPVIQLQNGLLCLQAATYDFKKDKFVCNSAVNIPPMKTDADQTTRAFIPLCYGQPDYRMQKYEAYSYLSTLTIPYDATVEIGISDNCVRFRTYQGTKLIPRLRLKKYWFNTL